MLLPLRLLWTLQISRKQKVALGCMFSLGVIVIVFAFVRLSNVIKATSQAKTNPTTLANAPILLSLWSTIEAAVAVLVANLPAFRSLLRTAANTRRTNSPRAKSGNLTAYEQGSHATSSRSAIKRHSMELESLHSADEIFGRTREHDRVFEMNKESHIIMTTDIKVGSRERHEGDAVEASNRKLGLAL
jgi:rhodopsin domain-containing protein